MRIVYIPKKFTKDHQRVIDTADAICEEYADQGLNLTLRQLYYQFVARGFIANKQSEYSRLGGIINDARMAGALDWEYLVDRTRNLVAPNTWKSPEALLKAVSNQYTTDLWAPQHHRIEVWIEKDAGIGVIERVCDDEQIPYFSCRGYTSASELWNSAQRIGNHLVQGNKVTILHIGDHDPSGLDMTRDIKERLATFLANDWNRSHHFATSRFIHAANRNEAIRSHMRATIQEAGGQIGATEAPWRVRRIALNHDQVLQYNPPPNPAKTTDARFEKYFEQTGLDESWELDALDPNVLQDLIRDEIYLARDDDTWSDSLSDQERDRVALTAVHENWAAIKRTYGITTDSDETEES